MTLEELKQKATASELALIEKVEALLVERDNEPARVAARLANFILFGGGGPMRREELLIDGAKQFFRLFPDLKQK